MLSCIRFVMKIYLTITLLVGWVSCAHTAPYVWDGNGDANNSGNWSDAANWDLGGSVPDDLGDSAELQTPSVVRYVTNDVDTTVGTLTMGAHGNNQLWLDANLTVSNFLGSAWQASVHMNGKTLAVHASQATYLPNLTGGGGLFLKVGPGTAYAPNNSVGYTGDYVISNGVFTMAGGWLGNGGSTSMTIHDGARVRIQSSPPGGNLFPPNMIIHGNGGGPGVIQNTLPNLKFYPNLTVASDALVTTDNGIMLTMHGSIDGPGGALTLDGNGGGTIELSNLASAYAKKLIVTNGTVIISGGFLNVTSIWVDAGGVLEGLQAQFPNAAVTTNNGGVWIQDFGVATWSGAGDGSNWTDTANWWPPMIPTNQATIPSPGSLQTVVIDAPAYVNTLVMGNHANSHLRLEADLTVSNFTGGAWQPSVYVNGNTLTLYASDASYLPNVKGGDGQFLKTGSGTCYAPNTSVGYTGNYLISNGVLWVHCGAMGAGGSSNMTIIDGARVQIMNPTPETDAFPSNVVVSGNGGGLGVLRNGYKQFNFHANLLVASNAMIYNDANGIPFIMHGDIAGPGHLTLEGDTGASHDLRGTFHYAINGAAGNHMIVGSQSLIISNCSLSITSQAPLLTSEYPLIDYSGGSVAGVFSSTNGLRAGWTIDYDGTSRNPNAVVLITGALGTIFTFR